MRRTVLIVTAATAMTALLGGCGSSPPVQAPEPGLNATQQQVEHFFDSQHGGQWRTEVYSGGTLGYATTGPGGSACLALMVGASYNISTVTVNCNTRTTVSSNPQLTQAIMEATVHHFAPGATAWITSQLQDAFAMPTTKFMETSTETDGLTVQLTQTLGHPNGDFSLVIQPSQLVPPTTAPPTATPPTTAPPTTAPPTTATTS